MKEIFLFSIISGCLTVLYVTKDSPKFAVSKLDYVDRTCEGTAILFDDGFRCDGKRYKWK